MSDLKRYINKRKTKDPEFSKNFDEGYTEFKIGVVIRDFVKIGHGVKIRNCVSIGNGVTIGNGTTLSVNTHVGNGETIKNFVTI